MAAMVHNASNYPLEILKAVPLEGWCIEVQRFTDQIRGQHMALSGCGFFFLTKGMILTVCSSMKIFTIKIVFDVDEYLQMLALIFTWTLVIIDFDV